MIQVKVIGPKAKFIPGVGTRQPGESFWLPEALAAGLRNHPHFEVVTAAPAPKKAKDKTE